MEAEPGSELERESVRAKRSSDPQPGLCLCLRPTALGHLHHIFSCIPVNGARITLSAGHLQRAEPHPRDAGEARRSAAPSVGSAISAVPLGNLPHSPFLVISLCAPFLSAPEHSWAPLCSQPPPQGPEVSACLLSQQ